MNKREIYKTVKIDDREFRIGKFDAMSGSYIAYKLMGEMLPMGLKVDGVSAPSGSKVMEKKDFIDLQKDCLMICEEVFERTNAPIMNANGSWGVEDLENNSKVVLALTIQALVWNISDFFTEDLLTSLTGSMQDLKLQKHQI